MPPKMYPIIAPPSPVIPTEINDDYDVLCVMDMLDTLDSIPGELTQRFGDLRELDAVLNATTVHLTSRLEALTRILQQASSASSSTSSSTFNSTFDTTSNTSALVASIAKSPVQSSSAIAAPPVATSSKTDDPEEPPSLGKGTSVPDVPATTTMSTITINATPAKTAILAADGTAVTTPIPISTSVPTSDPDRDGGRGSEMKIHASEHAKGKEMASITEMNVEGDAGSGPGLGPGPGTAAETRDTGDTVEVGRPAEQPENTTVGQSGDKQEEGVDETESGSGVIAKAVEDVVVVESPAAENTGTTGAGGDAAESAEASAIPKDSTTIPAQDTAPASKAVTMDIDPVPITSPDQDPVSAPVPPMATTSAQGPLHVSKSIATAGESALALDQPWDRFQILLEIAEELSRFKVGVEDKVKVAGSACDHVIQHQSHIASLLSSSTLLLPAYPTSHLNNQQGYLPQQTLDRGMTNGGTSSSGVGGKRHRNSPMPSRYANLVSTNGNSNGGALSGGMQNPNASSGNHANGNGSGSGGYGQVYAPAPGSETPSKKRRKTGAGAGGQGGGGKEKKGSAAAAGGPGWWDEEESVGGKGGKRWDGRSQTQNPFNADPRGSSNPFTSPFPDYASHLQQTNTNSNTTTTGAGGKQRNSPSVAGSVRGGSVMPSIAGDPNSKTGNTGGGGGKKKSGAGAGGTKKQAAGAGGEGKSGQGSTSTPSTAGGGGGGRKKGQGKSGLATGGAGGAGTAEEYGYYNPGGGNSAGMGGNGSQGQGQAGSRTATGPSSGAQNHHHNHNRNRNHERDPNSNLDHDMDHDPDADPEAEADADADADTRLYCYCQKQSYGEMIGCDDDGCQFEWFHLSCLLLDRPPEGTWLCPDCAVRAESKKKRGGGGGKGGGGGRKGK